MPICAVCGKANDTLVCKGCGFDGSCDYEQYPSLGRPAQRPDPISRRRAALKAGSDTALRCPKCGGTQFSVAMEAGEFLCAGCGHRLPMPGVPGKSQTPPAPKPATAASAPVSKPAAAKPVNTTPPAGKPAAPTPPPAKPVVYPTLPAKNSGGFLIRLTLTLGWFITGFIGFALADCFLQDADPSSMTPLAAFLSLLLVIQLRLLRKGFQPLFGSRIPYGLHNFVYIFMALDFAVTTFVGYYFVTDSADLFASEGEQLLLTVLVVVLPLYFMFWALGQRGSRKKK